MGYHPRIEWKNEASFLTTRSRNSRLWFVNNRVLEDAILGYAARYSKRYSVKLYALAIEGNHIQAPAHFPLANRADFMRDFNSTVARAVPRYTPEYEGGIFWGRRYSAELVPAAADIEDRFFYTVLQAVNDGHVERISEYPGYNCFHDAVWGVKRRYKVVRWGEYNAARRYNPKLAIKDYTDTVELEYTRIPGYEHLSQRDYAHLMEKKLEERRVKIVNERRAKGLEFLGREKLLKIKRGSRPKNTKTSTSESYRPRVLSVCPKRRQEYEARYYDTQAKYKIASKAYRAGDLTVEFPEGTYRPSIPGGVGPAAKPPTSTPHK